MILLAGLMVISCTGDSEQADISYLGQTPPGLIPEMFAQFIAPPEDHKHSAPAFSPDGTELYFSVYENDDYPQRIKFMRQADGVWSEPELAPFSGEYQEGGPALSPDRRYLFFCSHRTGAEEIFWVDASVIDSVRTD